MNKQEKRNKFKELYETTHISLEAIGVEIGLTGETVGVWAKAGYSDDCREARKSRCISASKMGDKNPMFGKKGNLKHGESHTRLYRCWRSMKERAESRIDCVVCPEWLEYETFAGWAMSNGYTEDLLICRNGDVGNYEPSNARWDTRGNNAVEGLAKTYEFIYKGELVSIYNLRAYCREHGLNASNLHNVWTGKYKHSQGYSLPCEYHEWELGELEC